jgi:phosphate:Na+ symporter
MPVAAGEAVTYQPAGEAIWQIEQFLESLPLETIDLGTIGPRLVRLCHALDHLTELEDDLTHIPPTASDWQHPPAIHAGARAVAAWVDATKEPEAQSAPAVFKALEDSSKQLGAERKTDRHRILEDVALQRMPSATARRSRHACVGRRRRVPCMASGRIDQNRLRQIGSPRDKAAWPEGRIAHERGNDLHNRQ